MIGASAWHARIEDLAIVAPLVGGDRRGIKTLVAGRDAFLFPADLQVFLLDGRRESIVMDHAFTDEFPGIARSDALAGRNGLHGDELQMIRPGFISVAPT